MAILNYDGTSHLIEKIVNLLKGKSNTDHKHTKSDITDFPTLGTASSKDVASTGNASSGQVVMGNDTRLSDARKASDVFAWAKASTKPSYTKSEVGLANVDNTSDTSKPVSTAQQTAIDAAYTNSNKYTDKKIADLIGSAPETMDTLEEVAAAIQKNKDVETALNEAIGKKANQTELDTHVNNTTIHITASERANYHTAYEHSQAKHARTDATKVEKSTTNGNIKINGTETTVYTHPGSGTNPHGTTKSDVGLGNVGNFKAVSTVANQGLSNTEKSNARSNIGAQVAGSYASSSHTHDEYVPKSKLCNETPIDPDLSNPNSTVGADMAMTPRAGQALYNVLYKQINDYTAGKEHNHDDRYYTESEIDSKLSGKASSSHTHTKSQITDFPTSMPASDVYSWAKASSKPSYTKSEVGLGNVDNTADSAKSVKYATSSGSADSASKANAITDYNQGTKTIQIGYAGSGIAGDDIKYIAGYTTGNGSDVNAKIKDVSKDALKSWLGLGSLAYSSATIPTIPSSLPANGGTATYANYVWATSHKGSWYQNSQWDGTYFQTNYKNGDSVLPMRVNNAGYADSAGSANSVAWANVSGKPSTFTPSSHSHNYNDLSNKPTLGSAASKTVRTLSASGASGWKDLSTDQGYVPDMAFMAYWNGAYSGSASNLAYCNKGAFGTAATSNKGDFATASHTHSNYLTGITKSMVTTALGYTPPKSDTNTWRPVQNNLTSTSTTDSLSAAQGKILKDMINNNSGSGKTNYESATWIPKIGYQGESSYYYLYDGKYEKIGDLVFLTCCAGHFKANGEDTVYISKSSIPFPMAENGFMFGRMNNGYAGSCLINYDDPIYSFSSVKQGNFSASIPVPYVISIIYRTTK